MFKKAMLFLGILLMASAFAYAEEKLSVSGEVTFQYDGNIYICLLTMEEFRDLNIREYKLSQSSCKIIQMNTELKQAGKVSFTFDNIAKGTYCVFTYQDVNMNGEVDRVEGSGISEPWGSYKAGVVGFVPTWGALQFYLEKDITGIRIDM